jgi:hypothetical protein
VTLPVGLRVLAATLVTPFLLGAQTGFVSTSDSARLYYRIIGHGSDTIIASTR